MGGAVGDPRRTGQHHVESYGTASQTPSICRGLGRAGHDRFGALQHKRRERHHNLHGQVALEGLFVIGDDIQEQTAKSSSARIKSTVGTTTRKSIRFTFLTRMEPTRPRAQKEHGKATYLSSSRKRRWAWFATCTPSRTIMSTCSEWTFRKTASTGRSSSKADTSAFVQRRF